ENTHHAGEIKLFPEAVLGIFPQAGSQLVPDYKYLMDAENFSNLEDFFVRNGKVGENPDEQTPEPSTEEIREEKQYMPFEADAWHEYAIRKLKDSSSIVVPGPPGTGKTQLICFLVADAVASGKKVIVVRQKRAALDVVYRSLQEIKIDDFLDLVHGSRNE